MSRFRLQGLRPSIGPALRRFWPALVLLVQPVILFWTTLITDTTHIPWDLPGFHTTLSAYTVEALRNGRLPLWDPYAYAGRPFHADVTAQLFYPPAWIGFAFGIFREHAILYWLEWLVALHLVLGGLGGYILLRRLACGKGAALFGATAFQLGCFFVSQPQHLGAVSVAAWMPFVWLGVAELARGFTRGRFCLLAAALAMSFLGGFPAVTLVSYLTAAVLATALAIQHRNRWLVPVTAAAFLAAAALSAIQLIPSIEATARSTASNRWMWNEPGGLPFKALIGAIWPNWLHVFTPFNRNLFKEPANFTFLYFYNGQLTVWLALSTLFLRKGRIFLFVALICALVMCGGALPGYHSVFQLLPKTIQSAVYTESAQAGFSLAMAVAAALCLQQLTALRAKWVAAIALATGLELLLIVSNRPMNTGDGGWRPHDSTRQMMHDAGLLARLRTVVHESAPPLRTDTVEYCPRFTGSAALLRLPSANGDNAMAPLRMLAYRGLYTNVVPWARQYPIVDFSSSLINAANVGFIMREGPPLDAEQLKDVRWQLLEIKSERPLTVYRNPDVLPRYRLVTDVRTAKRMNGALNLLTAVDLRTTAVVEGPVRAALPDSRAPGAVSVLRYSPEHVSMQVDAAGPSFLVAAEGYDSGWRARVDGQAQPVYPANVAFMGVWVPAGKHTVQFDYRPASLMWGAGIAGLAWALAGFWMVFGARRAKHG